MSCVNDSVCACPRLSNAYHKVASKDLHSNGLWLKNMKRYGLYLNLNLIQNRILFSQSYFIFFSQKCPECFCFHQHLNLHYLSLFLLRAFTHYAKFWPNFASFWSKYLGCRFFATEVSSVEKPKNLKTPKKQRSV